MVGGKACGLLLAIKAVVHVLISALLGVLAELGWTLARVEGQETVRRIGAAKQGPWTGVAKAQEESP